MASRGRGFANQSHVGLGFDEYGDALSYESVIGNRKESEFEAYASVETNDLVRNHSGYAW